VVYCVQSNFLRAKNGRDFFLEKRQLLKPKSANTFFRWVLNRDRLDLYLRKYNMGVVRTDGAYVYVRQEGHNIDFCFPHDNIGRPCPYVKGPNEILAIGPYLVDSIPKLWNIVENVYDHKAMDR
jgi:hypothetical protein